MSTTFNVSKYRLCNLRKQALTIPNVVTFLLLTMAATLLPP